MREVLVEIIEKHMIEQGDRIIAGVSGGADSVCLFFLLLELKKEITFDFMVVHINHQIRGKEALEDQKYVEELCEKNKIELKVVSENVKKIAEIEKLSEEEAGRKVRYKAFKQALKEWNGNKIALAHHKNDQAETVLWNLIRGSGLKGMTGMKRQRDCYIRPLLSVTRKEIEEYLKENNISYQTDSTNQTLDYTRNKIRLMVFPYIADELNERVIEHIANTAEIFQEIQNFIDKVTESEWSKIVKEEKKEYYLEKEAFLIEDFVIQKAILQKVLNFCADGLKDITNEHITMLQQLFHKEVGKKIELPRKTEAVRTYKGICVYHKKGAVIKENFIQKDRKTVIAVPGITRLETEEILVECRVLSRENFFQNKKEIEKNSKKSIINQKNCCTKCFDYDKISNTVFLRKQQTGDMLQIGRNGEHKKLNRFFIDCKIPKEERKDIWILAEEQEVIWVIGERISEAYRVTERTKHILQITVKR